MGEPSLAPGYFGGSAHPQNIHMKVAKIADLQNLADGSVIGEMTVQVKAVFPARKGEGKHGPWRVQPVILKDSTGEVRASFWVDDDLEDLKGQTITIKSVATNKGLSGISVKHSDHSGSNEVSVNGKAGIYDSASPERNQSSPTYTSAAVKAGGTATVDDAKRIILQKAKLYIECLKATDWIKEQHQLSDEHYQATVASLFISADKLNLSNYFKSNPTPKPEPVEDKIPMGDEEVDNELGW